MRRRMLKSKIHRAVVTDADLHYVGSVTIDPDLLDAADILEHEQVAIVDIDNGARFAAVQSGDQRGYPRVVRADRRQLLIRPLLVLRAVRGELPLPSRLGLLRGTPVLLEPRASLFLRLSAGPEPPTTARLRRIRVGVRHGHGHTELSRRERFDMLGPGERVGREAGRRAPGGQQVLQPPDSPVDLLGALPGVGLPALAVRGLLFAPVARRGPLGGPLLPLLLPLCLCP